MKRRLQVSGSARRRGCAAAVVAFALAGTPLSALAQEVPEAPEPPVAEAPAAEPGKARVDFSATEPGLSVLGRPVTRPGAKATATPGDFSLLCVAPCSATLPENSYQFAVRRDGGPVLPSPLAYELSGPSRFRATVISRESTRREGFYVLGIVGGAGLISTTTALIITCGENRECAKWTSVAFWGGLGALSLGALIGLPMLTTKDELSISVLPLAPGPAPVGRFSTASDADSPVALRGLTIAGSL